MPDDRSPVSGHRGQSAVHVTIREVAELAEVAVGTVSNVLNRPSKVAPETVRRVRQAIEELGWTPHQGAKQLGGGRSVAVGVIIARLSPHTIELLEVMDDAFDENGFVLQVSTSGHQPEREIARIELFEQQRVRGILLSPTDDYQAHLQRLRQLDIPLVVFGRASTVPELCSISGDDTAGGALAAAHLVSRSHRGIAVVGGTASTQQVQARLAGVRTALPSDATLTVIRTTEYDTRAGLAAAQHLAALPAAERPTGVFAINDSIAIGLQRGLQSAGLSVPGDIAIVGYDDSDIAQTAPVALTSVRVPNVTMGQYASQLLLEEMASASEGTSHVHRQLLIRPKLVVRESTGPVG